MREREEILHVHVRNKPVGDVDLRRLAEATPMFSGADLENLANEAALVAARSDRQSITWTDFNEALDRITLGLRRGSLVPTAEERRILAYHEAGHAVAFAAQETLGQIRKVTIMPRGGAGGFMAPLAKEEMFYSVDRFKAQLVVAFGSLCTDEIGLRTQLVGRAPRQRLLDVLDEVAALGLDQIRGAPEAFAQ
jgi:cell division protease FtsH